MLVTRRRIRADQPPKLTEFAPDEAIRQKAAATIGRRRAVHPDLVCSDRYVLEGKRADYENPAAAGEPPGVGDVP